MVVENDLEPMLSRLYEATLDPALWPAAWAEATSAAGATAPSLMVVADSGGSAPLAMPGWGRHALRPLAMPDIDPPHGGSFNAGPAGNAAPSGAPSSDVGFPDAALSYTASPMAVSSGAALIRSAQALAAQPFTAEPLPAVAQSLADPAPLGRSVPEVAPVCRALLDQHLRRAVRLRARLATARIVQAASAAALRAADTGVILVTPGGRIVYADRTAHLLAGIVGLQLASARGGMQASEPEATLSLHSLIHDAAAGGPGGDLLMRATNGCAVAVSVCALIEEDGEDGDATSGQELWQSLEHEVMPVGAAQILVTLRRLVQVPACPRRVAALFGLTRSEADVAVAITAGQAVAVVAAGRGVSANTVQGQVRSALVKAGVPGVQELALLFARLG